MHVQIIKYLLVGILNTTVGLGLIYVCMAVGVNDVASNAIGYAVGFCVSFFMNSKWTFRQKQTTSSAMCRFLLVSGIAYGGNLLTMLATRDLLHVDHRLAQIAGMLAYTTIGFFGARLYAFQARHKTKKPA